MNQPAINPSQTDRCAVDARLYDLRTDRRPASPKIRMRGGRPVVRDPSGVRGVVIHQTAVEYGVSARQLRAAGGDRDLALARRSLDVACHAMAFRGGFFAACAPLPWHVNGGNGLNPEGLHLEVDGRYAGRPDDPRTIPRREDLESTWGGEPSELTPDTIRAACAALRWLVDEGRAEGMPIEWIWAHRQSSATRRSDPGHELWGAVVEGYARPVLGLRVDYARTVGSGRPIPVEWAPGGVGSY